MRHAQLTCARLHAAWVHRPYTLVIALVTLVPAILALVYGDSVSAALSTIAAGVVSRVIGALLVGGSCLTLYGIARDWPFTEILGIVLTALGTAIYGVAVLLGLGLHGAMAGPLALAISLAAFRRVVTLTPAASVASTIRGGDGE